MIQRRYELSDEQWEQIKDMFPPYKTGRPSKLSNRTMFKALHDSRFLLEMHPIKLHPCCCPVDQRSLFQEPDIGVSNFMNLHVFFGIVVLPQ